MEERTVRGAPPWQRGDPGPRRWPSRRRSGAPRQPSWWRGPRQPGPLRRPRAERLAGGVAAGIAAWSGLNVTLVRTLFVLATLVSGFGGAVYVVAWLLVPTAGEDGNIAARALHDRRGIAVAAGFASLLVVVLLIANAFGATWLASLAWPMIIVAAGLVLIWRNAPADEQDVIRRVAEPLAGLAGTASRTRLAVRMVLALLLTVAGLSALLSQHHLRSALRPLAGVALIIAAIVVVLGPWWLGIARDLVVERQARARAEERADLAARLHDSVLQTLALIQLKAGTPAQVIQLARAQERELRSWLFGGQAPGTPGGQAETLAAGVRSVQQEVEAQHGVPVEAVTVGDCDLDDRLRALLAAAREATVNAVKWSGAPVVSVFAEVEPSEVSVFVRDRGRGFDPSAVPADRKGLAESIRGRMTRSGGTAAVRSAPGEGTEVSLSMKSPEGFRLRSVRSG